MTNPLLEFITESPFRRPRWRNERVMKMIAHRPSPLTPLRKDDHYVRLYRRFLLNCIAAGENEGRLAEVFSNSPELAHAHLFHAGPDVETKHILEARLLTNESFDEIARRFATQAKAIEYYEALFFHTRDRLDRRDWISLAVLRPPHAGGKRGIMTAEQRGYVYKLFAYSGGPLVLDALINGIGDLTMPQQAEETGEWFDEALGRIVRRTAAMAASVLSIDQRTSVRLIQLAMKTAVQAATDGGKQWAKYEQQIMSLLGNVEFVLAEKSTAPLNELEQRVKQTPIEPRATEQIMLANGIMPESLAQEIERFEAKKAAEHS